MTGVQTCALPICFPVTIPIYCVISQTMSERQAVLQQLASEKSELTKYAEAMLAEQQSAPDPSPAPAGAAS